MSVTSRMDGSVVEIDSFWAMYSLRMSVWIVPRSSERGTPWFSATPRSKASAIGAVQLIVMDVETSPSGMPENSVSMSSSESIATPSRPTSPSERGWSQS